MFSYWRGIAGLRAALAIRATLDILVVTKDKIQQSNSTFAREASRGCCLRKIASRTISKTR